MKKILIAILLLSAAGFGVYKFLNQKQFISSEKSPDGKYIVETYAYKRFFAAPGDGGVGSSSGYIRLLDKDGNKIGDTSDCPPFSLSDIELDLGVINNKFFYSRGGAINLKTGKCD